MTDESIRLNIIKEVLEKEGGYSNDPNDPGGETNFGISKRSYPELNIKDLTEEKAIDIYERIWVRAKVWSIPEDFQEIYFDMVVNHGRSRAVILLQRAANLRVTNGTPLVEDGKIGPKTLRRLKNKKIEKKAIVLIRIKFYLDITKRNPKLKKFLFGWFNRALYFLDE